MRKDRVIGAAMLSLAATAGMAGTGPGVASQVPGLVIMAMSALPAAPTASAEREACAHLLQADPATPAGQAAAAQGWGVTGEVAFGRWTAVSFVGRYVGGTSGSCELLDGNVGLFDGNRLVALIYAQDGTTALIGSVSAFGDGGLRIFSGDTLPSPVADLRRIGSDGIAVTPPALDEPVCKGTARVPFIYGLPIDLARDLLAEAGWQPVPGTTGDSAYGQAPDIAKAGVPEVEDCSGTGFGFCGYRYHGPAGDLGVTTAGEISENGILPAVTGYGVTCSADP